MNLFAIAKFIKVINLLIFIHTCRWITITLTHHSNICMIICCVLFLFSVLPVNNIQSEIDSVVNPNIVLTDSSQVGGQPIQLEDGTTAFLHHTPKGLSCVYYVRSKLGHVLAIYENSLNHCSTYSIYMLYELSYLMFDNDRNKSVAFM